MSASPQPLVSIVIATYDRIALLDGAIRSALAQTYPALEIIVCDDAGPRDVAGVVSTFGDPRVRYLRSDVNTMKAGAFAMGLREARGEYVMGLDDDDLLAPHCVKTLVEALERDPDLVVAFGDHWVIDSAGAVDEHESDRSSRRWGRDRLLTGRHAPFIDLALVTQALCMNVCGMARRSRLDVEDFPPQVAGMSDHWLAYLACRDGGAAWYCGERLSYYRHHSDNLTGVRNDLAFTSRSFTFEAILRDDRMAGVRPHLLRQLKENELAYSSWLLATGRRREAGDRARRARVELRLPGRALRTVEVLSRVPGLGPMAADGARRVAALRRPR